MIAAVVARPTVPGDDIRFGDLIGGGLEPVALGRVCGFIKDAGGKTLEVCYRAYRDQDEKWPSGNVYSRRMGVVWPVHSHSSRRDFPYTRRIRGDA